MRIYRLGSESTPNLRYDLLMKKSLSLRKAMWWISLFVGGLLFWVVERRVSRRKKNNGCIIIKLIIRLILAIMHIFQRLRLCYD